MTRMRRGGAAGLLALTTTLALLVPFHVQPAQAAPPGNDSIRNATVLPDTPSTPSRTTFDTLEATSARSDGDCVRGHSVWFTFVADTSMATRLTTAGSDFDTLLAIFEGPRRAPRLVDCDDDRGPGNTSAERFPAEQGTRYWIAVSSFRGAGGPAVLTIEDVTTTDLEITVDEARSGMVSGRLIVSGTFTCATYSDTRFTVGASQRAGDGVARGRSTRWGLSCDETPRPWTARLDSDTGWAFHTGEVLVHARARSWDGISRERMSLETIVTAVDDPNARAAR